MKRHGGKILVDHLVAEGVTRVFSVPGESFLAALDGLYESGVQNIVCRHEGGASMMAEAHGKMTGKPGICFVTRGPGAANACAGIHVAAQDSTPMIVFIGQNPRGVLGREAWQEVDHVAHFTGYAKWAAEVVDTKRLPEYLSRAFHVAQSGRPGPVVLSLPEDMLAEEVDVPDLPPRVAPIQSVMPAQVDALIAGLMTAERPMVVVGGSIWSEQAARDLERFAAAFDVPVAASWRRADRMDNRSAQYIGDLGLGMNPRLAKRMQEADCLLVLGSRLGDIATGGYALVPPGAPGKTILHVHSDPDELGKVFRPDVAVPLPAPMVLAELAARPGPEQPVWGGWTRAARADHEAWLKPTTSPGAVKLEDVVLWLSDNLPDDAIATNGAGNYAGWVHRYFRPRSYPGHISPTSGSMGYGFPAAISAKLEAPHRTVVCFAGDGCFQMTLNELSTCVQFDVAVIVIVCNNGRFGSIRMHQEKYYPRRISGSMLANPNYADLAAAYGLHGEQVTDGADFPAAFERARASGKTAIIELMLDPEMLTTTLTIEQMRALSEGKKTPA